MLPHVLSFQFAILRAEHDAANSACPSAGSLGSTAYLVFLVLYVAVGLVSSVQLMRLFRWLSWRKQWLAMTQYSLITAVCFFRALNHAVYYTLYKDLSFASQTLISGLPYLFVSWSVRNSRHAGAIEARSSHVRISCLLIFLPFCSVPSGFSRW
jgi:hypothetical protein